jgi:hypothetical protein
VPLNAALVNEIVLLVLFVNVTLCAALVWPTCTVPKSIVVPAAGTTASVGISVSFATNASLGPFRAV